MTPDLPNDSAALNLKQTAVFLGVHYMTAYRYVRQGRLAATRVGTEWRVARHDLEVFRGFGADSGGDNETATWLTRLEKCLWNGDETAAWRVIELALASGYTVTYCYIEMLNEALKSITQRCAKASANLASEQIATTIAMRLVARLGARFRRPGRSRGSVVFGAAPGEMGGLCVAIPADLIRLEGYDVIELGTSVPPAAFVAAAALSSRLHAIGIAATRIDLIPAVQEVVNEIRAHHRMVPIVVNGLPARSARELQGVDGVARFARETVASFDALSRNALSTDR